MPHIFFISSIGQHVGQHTGQYRTARTTKDKIMIYKDSNNKFVYGMKVVVYKRANGSTYSRRRKYVLAHCDKCGSENWVRADNANSKMVSNAENNVRVLAYYCQNCRPIGIKLNIPEIS